MLLFTGGLGDIPAWELPDILNYNPINHSQREGFQLWTPHVGKGTCYRSLQQQGLSSQCLQCKRKSSKAF
ncbi:Hypothetical predicted protein [Podarcis lilfordi]|uniref:Uncharacterized protein n=1 Tax=Podarcis lilfordi TaxID=74358 RepID=A0AA35P5T7_9SAUR|nr:Hypothetical predicted protein [Podarcis lilfordi]